MSGFKNRVGLLPDGSEISLAVNRVPVDMDWSEAVLQVPVEFLLIYLACEAKTSNPLGFLVRLFPDRSIAGLFPFSVAADIGQAISFLLNKMVENSLESISRHAGSLLPGGFGRFVPYSGKSSVAVDSISINDLWSITFSTEQEEQSGIRFGVNFAPGSDIWLIVVLYKNASKAGAVVFGVPTDINEAIILGLKHILGLLELISGQAMAGFPSSSIDMKGRKECSGSGECQFHSRRHCDRCFNVA